MADISKIKTPDGTVYDLKDSSLTKSATTINMAQNNTTYVGSGSMFYVVFGKICVVSGDIKLKIKKPSGQANYLCSGFPKPKSAIGLVRLGTNSAFGGGELFVNGSGNLTANNEISNTTDWMRISGAYVCA